MKVKGPRASDADMTWRRADGTMGEYRGELVELGMGIPRRKGAFGIRRAAFDLAFGYVSGFPVRDIIPFAVRSLFPGRRHVYVTADEVQPITCEVPPPGWWCSRDGGHDGPCAAHPWRDDPRLYAGMPR
ncbi:hypothetical protein [Microbacterium sp. YJN-G]|uniref:hypothetical protein n=1 Tax=Microbacterium sp. YJN-G TaxID=2763257 RepID=UPI001877DB17|nr:hypothetical protein [Microbacterium sp. YJN-G]